MDEHTESRGIVGQALIYGTICVVGLALIVGLFFGLGALGKTYSRYQKRQDANNQVKVTEIMVQKAQQQARVNYAQIQATKAEAEKRYQESIGIRRAQDEISSTLTPLYVQHEAIQAQKAATQDGNAQIYIPSGDQGVPLVRNIAP